MSGHHDCCNKKSPPITLSSVLLKILSNTKKVPRKVLTWVLEIPLLFLSWVKSKDFIALMSLLAITSVLSLLRGFRLADFEEYSLMFKGDWRSRMYTLGLVFSFFGVYHVWMLPAVDVLMLFGPAGDIITVGGRHEQGDATWFLVKRAHAIAFHVCHYLIIILLVAIMKDRDPVLFPRASSFMNWLSIKTGLRFMRIKADRVLTSAISLTSVVVFGYMLMLVLLEARLPFPACVSEKNRTLAEDLHVFYLWSSGLQLAWSVAVVLNKSSPNWKSCFETYPVTYWFWGLVLYYCPADDVWVSMSMECVRIIITAYCRMFNRDLPIVGPITAIPEVVHFIASASGLCPYPKVLWLRLPGLCSALIILAGDIKRRLTWARKYNGWKELVVVMVKSLFGYTNAHELEKVVVYVLVSHPSLKDVGKPTKSMKLPQERSYMSEHGVVCEPLIIDRGVSGPISIPGEWYCFETTCLITDAKVQVEKEGQFKILQPLLDVSERLGRDVYGRGSHRYLAKRYARNPEDKSELEGELDRNRVIRHYFSDVLMQDLTAYFANKYSENEEVPCKIELVKACVIERQSILVVGGGVDQNNHVDFKYKGSSGDWVNKTAVLTPNRYQTPEAFAAEAERALNSVEGCPIKFNVRVVQDESWGKFVRRFCISGDAPFDLMWIDGPSGVVCENAAELFGFDNVMDWNKGSSYTGDLNPARSFYLVERCMDGCYTKYNSNSFWPNRIDISSGRNTPWAFTHFSYKFSNRRLLICDIQGVGDYYTDPQIHTDDPELRKYVYNAQGFWNKMNSTGMLAVLLSHKFNCDTNEICQNLKITDFWWQEEQLDDGVKEQVDTILQKYHEQAHVEAELRQKVGYRPEPTGLGFNLR